MSDSFCFDITDAPLDKSLEVAFSHCSKIVGWTAMKLKSTDNVALVFYRTQATGVNTFPCPIGLKEVQPIIEQWLEQAEYGEEPDTDGHCTKGHRVFCENWGHVDGQWEALFAVEPVWMMHGK